MPAQISLDRLQSVPLREAWFNEAGDFTPWLASPENIGLLGDAVGVSLEVEATEQEVGPFRADIVCRNQADDTLVLIENQIERTDHSHLGQLLTYAAGLEAVTVIWVASRFTEEHRAALDWLNSITEKKFNFFGLEIELWRIGNSAAAPKFNVVCQPNEWVRTTGSAILGVDALSPTRQRQQQYWTDFKRLLVESGSRLRTASPRPDSGFNIAIGRRGFYLAGVISSYNAVDQVTPQPNVRAQLAIEHPESVGMMRALLARKDEVESKVGEPLVWMPVDDVSRRKRAFISLPANIDDPADWPRQHRWLQEKLEVMAAVFAPIVRELQALAAGADVSELV